VTGGGLGLTAGTLIAPPIGIAIGLGLGSFYAYQAFKGKNRSLFTSEFRSWMAEQCNQTQVTINTTFQREMIDVQDEMRSAVKDALAERERQVKASLQESKRLLAAEESERKGAQADLRSRLEACRSLQKDMRALLEALGAPGGAPNRGPAPASPAPAASAAPAGGPGPAAGPGPLAGDV
jgi:hypothetical protein